jgi:hypothetical protein
MFKCSSSQSTYLPTHPMYARIRYLWIARIWTEAPRTFVEDTIKQRVTSSDVQPQAGEPAIMRRLSIAQPSRAFAPDL